MTENIAFKVVFKSTSLNSLPLREGLRLGDEISWLLTILEEKKKELCNITFIWQLLLRHRQLKRY